jgi:hypothetical protein
MYSKVLKEIPHMSRYYLGGWLSMKQIKFQHVVHVTGVPMYIIPDDVIYDPPQLVTFLTENRITRMLFTPSLLQAVLEFKGLDLNKAFQFMRCVCMLDMLETTLVYTAPCDNI